MQRAPYFAVCLLLVLSASPAWSQRSSYDPAARQPTKQPDGLVDFAMKQVNPQNTDYGCQMEETRKFVVDQTIKNINSWAVLVALSFLVLSFFMLLHQHREGNRRELVAAGFLAQYHNAWVDARMQADEAIRRYNELVDRTNTAAEMALRSQAPDTERAQTRTVKPDLKGDVKPQSAPIAAAKSSVKAAESVRRNGEPEVDLIAQINTLQQQLNASHEREKALQKELSKAHQRPQPEPARSTNVPN